MVSWHLVWKSMLVRSDWFYNTDVKFHPVKALNERWQSTNWRRCLFCTVFHIWKVNPTRSLCYGEFTCHFTQLNLECDVRGKVRTDILSGPLFSRSLFGLVYSAWFLPLFSMFLLSCSSLSRPGWACLPLPHPGWLSWLLPPLSSAVGSGSVFLPGLWRRPAASQRNTITTQSNDRSDGPLCWIYHS